MNEDLDKCFDFSEFGVNLIAIVMIATVLSLFVVGLQSLRHKMETTPQTVRVEQSVKPECNCGCEKCKCVKGK